MQSFENAAMATKTVCKTGLYIGGVVAGGGVANGILEAGGMIIGALIPLDIAYRQHHHLRREQQSHRR